MKCFKGAEKGEGVVVVVVGGSFFGCLATVREMRARWWWRVCVCVPEEGEQKRVGMVG